MVKSLLSEEDARRVEQAIQRVEAESATELVVAVVRQSGEYWLWRVLLAVGWALGAALLVHFWLPQIPTVWVLLAEPVVGGLVYALSEWEPLKRRLISPEDADRAVRARAFALFSERGLHRTRDRTGLLILVSELEHEVVILGDSGIHERLHEEGWTKEVSLLLQRIREGKLGEGLLEVIGDFETVLKEIAPARADNVNELPNTIVRE